MNSVIAAVAVTLVVNTADDKVSSSDGVLSLREAIAQANVESEAAHHRLKGKGLGYKFMKSALEVRARAPLTINGDANNDGLADVALANGFAEKLIIRQGSDVTVIGVDFYNGSGAGDAGKSGYEGSTAPRVLRVCRENKPGPRRRPRRRRGRRRG